MYLCLYITVHVNLWWQGIALERNCGGSGIPEKRCMHLLIGNFFPMDQHNERIIKALGRVKYKKGSWDERKAKDLCALLEDPDSEITAIQTEWMYEILYRYRKQLPHTYDENKLHPFCKYKYPRPCTL